jgi:hypothetical protein
MTPHLQDAIPALVQFLDEISQQQRSNNMLGGKKLNISKDEFLKTFGTGYTIIIFLCLVLARWWQSCLYNKGGWRLEFHQLSLPFWLSTSLVLLIYTSNDIFNLSRWTTMLSVPILFVGIATVHGIFAKLRLGWPWLSLFYILMISFGESSQIIIFCLVILDSKLNLRHRLSAVNLK